MLLENKFFTFNCFSKTDNLITGNIVINQKHEIFNGHFANQPVVPGVCMMQMIKEIFENIKQIKTNIYQGNELKFLAIIDPNINSTIDFEINYTFFENDSIKLNSKLFKADIIFFKFKGLLEIKFNT